MGQSPMGCEDCTTTAGNTHCFIGKVLTYVCDRGNGIWELDNNPDQFAGPGRPTPNYNVVRAANADAARFGTTLLKSTHVGAIQNPAVGKSVRPSAGLVVTSLDPQTLVGVFSGDGGMYAMVVDLRTEVPVHSCHYVMIVL